MIAIAAVRYFMIKFSRGKVIAFDLEEALSFEGESGPYIQYAVVRANNIFQKLQQRDGLDEAALLKALKDVPTGELDGANGSHELWSLVLDASRLDEIVEQVIRSLEFSVLAKYAFTLAQSFNAFYHRAPILNEERDDVKRWRAAAVIYLRAQLTRALDLMGIDVPARMYVTEVRGVHMCERCEDIDAGNRHSAVQQAARLRGIGAPRRRRGARARSGRRLARRRRRVGAGAAADRRGGDVLPTMYGAIAHPTFDAAEPGRDEYEIELVRLALAADLPVFAICRGIQVLNVARGGTLIQDIPDEVGTTVNHRVAMPPHSIAHDVWIESGSLLERLMGERFEAGDAWPGQQPPSPGAEGARRGAHRVRDRARRRHRGDRGSARAASASACSGTRELLQDRRVPQSVRRVCAGVQNLRHR